MNNSISSCVVSLSNRCMATSSKSVRIRSCADNGGLFFLFGEEEIKRSRDAMHLCRNHIRCGCIQFCGNEKKLRHLPEIFNLGALKLTKQFYRRTDTTAVAEELLGCLLHVRTPEGICTGRIVETEAYCGREDRGCHAFGGRRTPNGSDVSAGGDLYLHLLRHSPDVQHRDPCER